MTLPRRKKLTADPAKTRAWQDRSRRRAAENARAKPGKPLPHESEKRKKERPTRRKILDGVRERGCVARELVPETACWGPIDGDERISRKRRPGGHLDEENVQGLCRAHHDWKTLHDVEAVRRGLSGHSWDDSSPGPSGG